MTTRHHGATMPLGGVLRRGSDPGCPAAKAVAA